MLLIEKSTVLVFSNLVFRLSNGFENSKQEVIGIFQGQKKLADDSGVKFNRIFEKTQMALSINCDLHSRRIAMSYANLKFCESNCDLSFLESRS